MGKKESQPFYVGISEPVEVRKQLLYSSKDLLSSLKAYERVKEIRAKKLETMYAYRRALEEVYTLCKKLRRVMPSAPMPKASRVIETQREEPVMKTLAPPAPKELETLNHLESELDAIERKLSALEK